ncbi:MAG: DUF4258 domain-containing protein [Armatimonadetes bacterium]|nr:DUF4258 domain-containing protein [Armatimonadota bacterium]
MEIQEIRRKAQAGQWAMSRHARKFAGQRCIRDVEVREALCEAELLENYPDDSRGPSCLVLGFTQRQRPLHVVCGGDPVRTLVIITTYEPKPPDWVNPWTRR